MADTGSVEGKKDGTATAAPPPPSPGGGDLSRQELESLERRMGMLDDIDVRVRVELGRCRMYVSEVLGLREGSVIELDKLAGDPVDIVVNGKLLARGEVLVLNDNFCVRITEIVNRDDRVRETER